MTFPVKTPYGCPHCLSRRTGPEWQPWRRVVAGFRLAEKAIQDGASASSPTSGIIRLRKPSLLEVGC